MAFEEIDSDTAEFFKNGELPVALQTAQDDAAAAEVARVAAEAAAEAAKLVVEPAVKVDPVAPAVQEQNPFLERLLQESDARAKALEAQLAKLTQQVEAKTAPVAPDPNTDPLGFLAHKIESVGKDLEALRTTQSQLTEQKTQQDNAQNFLNMLNQQVGEFMKTHPDYQDAYKHVTSLRQQEYAIRGMTPNEIRQQMSTDEIQLTQTAMRSNKNPAEVVYALAKQYGFKATAAPAGAAPAANPKLDTILKGQEVATSGVERGTPPTQITRANLKDMSEKDMNTLVSDDEAWNRLMGGRSKGIFD